MTSAILARVTVRSTIAPLMSEARISAGQVSQLIRGHHADVLEYQDTWLRVRGLDGYAGWCHAGYLHPPVPVVPESGERAPLLSVWRDDRRMALGCIIRRPDGTQSALPVGALLDADDVIIAGLAINGRGRSRYFAADPHLLVRRAVDLFTGTPYQWGGVTPWGADCSGFVQTMFALHGTQLPRDAWQQAECGYPIAGALQALQPADLLFFSDRDDARITHVAVAFGDARVVHCSLSNGGVGIDALDADTPTTQHLRTTFRFAKRIPL